MGSRKKKNFNYKNEMSESGTIRMFQKKNSFCKKDCLRISMNRDVERISRDERGTCSH